METLADRIARVKQEGTKSSTCELPVETFAKMQNALTLAEFVVPYSEDREIYRAVDNRGLIHVPCQALQIVFKDSAIKSQVAETFGKDVEGISVDIVGYDIERDGEGKPIHEEVPNPLAGTEGQPDTVKVPKLITQDENGNALEPKVLMSWRPQMGINRSKPAYGRLKNQDMLNLVPSRGVPRRLPTVPNIDPTAPKDPNAKTYDQTAFELIPGMESHIIKIMLHAEELGLTDLLPIIERIPRASNAPSRKTENQESGNFEGEDDAKPKAEAEDEDNPYKKGSK